MNIERDGHVHSPYCPHGSNDSFEKYITEAITKGIKEITFTEHLMFPKEIVGEEFYKTCAPDEKALECYFKEIDDIKVNYKDKIKVNTGLEVDYIEGYEEELRESLNKYGRRLDDGILSVHFLKVEDKFYAVDGLESFEDLLKSYDDDKKINAYYEMWRNTLISDTYEPGSTFKLITSTASVEENVIKPNEKFTCTGSVTVEGKRIKCWRSYRPHGSETFEQAVQNSCNPVFVELGKRLGVSKLYDYIEGFGLTSKTNIDLVGEANSILYKEKDVGPVELATISFGQSISVTPIQLIRAVSAIANDGKLMEPRLVKAYTDNEGNVVQEVKPKTVRQVVSTETSKKMLSVMESVVTDGGGKIAYLPGYRLGGKTGTAQKVIDGVYAQGKYICSFISVAPVDDPQIVVLAIVDEPTDVVAFGSTTAGPIIKEVMSQSLEYLGVKKEYTKEEKEENEKKQVEIPDVRNLTIKEATKILEEKKLESNLDTDIEVDEKKVVTDMFPKPGVKVNEGSSIILYYNNN